jgi:hypothetical protein
VCGWGQRDAALEAAAYSAKYRKYERDYLRRLNSLYFSGATADSGLSLLFLRIHTHKVPTSDGFVSIRNPNFFLYSLTSPENMMCVCVCVCVWMWPERGSEKGLLSCKGFSHLR